MSNVTNLRQFRKQSDRVKKRVQGDENAVLHGRSKAQKVFEATQNDRARKMLDQHQIEGEDEV
ncbi:DUF4169 family protein [Aliiroseovarius sp. PTFE2010]|uniref:DUF4169 family protein n=1 Tax=Aliiroseovarius sp. PTFE2010 TaxID=3417190 RepID=UPI003CE8A8B9